VLAGWGIADIAMPKPGPQLLSYAMRDPQCVKTHRPIEKEETACSEHVGRTRDVSSSACSHCGCTSEGRRAMVLVRRPVTSAMVEMVQCEGGRTVVEWILCEAVDPGDELVLVVNSCGGCLVQCVGSWQLCLWCGVVDPVGGCGSERCAYLLVTTGPQNCRKTMVLYVVECRLAGVWYVCLWCVCKQIYKGNVKNVGQ